jgi:hypothetical protein
MMGPSSNEGWFAVMESSLWTVFVGWFVAG